MGAAYVPVAERRRKAELAMEKLRKKGAAVSPVIDRGQEDHRVTFWGKAWCENLESYRDYENRLARGRTYVRNGSVVDLQIAPHEVTAMVSGSELYKVRISIGEVVKAQWKSICTDCAGGIDSLVELLQGRFSKGVMERICRQGAGLFPKPSEIRFSCSCPDYASMCKHVAAVLYGVGARLDAKPELLFRLRAVNENDLVADIGQVAAAVEAGAGRPARCWKPTIWRRCSVWTWAMQKRRSRRLLARPLRSATLVGTAAPDSGRPKAGSPKAGRPDARRRASRQGNRAGPRQSGAG